MEYKPLSGREFPRFSGLKTFFRLPVANPSQTFDVALLGIPFDGGASYRPGARFAPSRVREVSSLGRGYHFSKQIQIFEKLKVADVGDCPTVPIDLLQSYEKIQSFISELLNYNKKFISVGGDHSTTLPVLRALRKHYKKPLAFIHFDAHTDTYPAAWNCEYHHGSFVRHAIEEDLIDPKKTIQLGIRGPFAGQEDLEYPKKKKITLYTIDDIRKKSIESFNHQMKTKISNSFKKHPTYISFDVDCLDPAYAPGTGTPVVGGLTSYECQRILRELKVNLVAGDVVEICPAYDQSDITSLIGLDVMFEMLSIMSSCKALRKKP